MTVCKFYLKGTCRYGRNCRFEHPGEDDYGYQESLSVSNFSFKSALNEVVRGGNTSYNSQQNYQSNTNRSSNFGGFNFAQALEDNGFGNSSFRNQQRQDTQMLDGFSFAAAIQQVNNNQNSQFLNQQSHHQTTFGSFYDQQSPFGSTGFNQQLGFGQPHSSNQSFHQPYQSSPSVHNSSFGFVNTQHQSSAFGSFQQAPIASRFLAQSPQQSSNIAQPQSQQQQNKDPNFSDLQELSEAELNAFKSDKFLFRGIPIRAPPKVLC